MVWARDVSTRTYTALTGRIFSHPFLKKNRTAILVSVCIWLFVIAATAVLTRNAKLNLLNEFYDTGVRSANQMSEEINAPLLANDILTLNIAIKVLEKKLDPVFAAILDHSGTALAHSDPDIINKKLPVLDALKKLTTIKGVSVERGQYKAHKAVICFSREILFSNVSIGKIIFAMDAAKLNQADKKYNTILGIVITLSTLLLAGVIFMANRFRLQKEAKDLAAFEKMEKIGNGDYDQYATVRAVKEYFKTKWDQDIPIIAAGGVWDHDDLQYALAQGADGVQMGTRFVATHECDADPAFKQAYVNSNKEDIGIIQSPVGLPGRALLNSFLHDVKAGKKAVFKCPYRCITTCDYKKAPYCISSALANAKKGKLQNGFAFVGENAYRIKEIISVKELIDTLKEAWASISRLKTAETSTS